MGSVRVLGVFLLAAAYHALASAEDEISAHARRDVYATREVRRTRTAACLDDAVEEVRSIRYNDVDVSLSVAYANWASARSVPCLASLLRTV